MRLLAKPFSAGRFFAPFMEILNNLKSRAFLP